MSKQAIAGVEPIDASEVPVMTVWPSVARYRLGQWLGKLYANELGVYVFTLGNLAALASIPLAVGLYFVRVVQGLSYQLTNRRILERQFDAVRGAVALDAFDSLDAEQLPGQSAYHAADLVFRRQGVEVFRLKAVPHAESFRQTCLKTQLSHLTVKQALDREAARA